VSRLAQLHTLSLDGVGYASDGYTPLRVLHGSLRRLALVDCLQLPSCLPELTALEALMINDSAECLDEAASSGNIVVAALPQLARLTFLALSFMPGMVYPPAALAAASSLRSFHWSSVEGDVDALPAGPWLSGLERLEAHELALTNSLPALQSATRLQHLGVWCDEQSSLQQLSSLLSWAASHPTLQRLLIRAKPGLIASAFNAACDAQRRNPRLVIHGGESVILTSDLFL